MNAPPPSYENTLAGPDKVLDASSYTSDKLDKPVKIRYSEVDAKTYPTMSVYTMFKKTMTAFPSHNALAFKANNSQTEWAYFDYSEYWKICNKAAKSFIKVDK